MTDRLKLTLFNWRWWLVLPLMPGLLPFALLAWLLDFNARYAKTVSDFYTWRVFGFMPRIGEWVRKSRKPLQPATYHYKAIKHMSYCRWSSDDFQCDVYVYESCYGSWEIHLAGNRLVFKEPLPEKVELKTGLDHANAAAYVARMRKVSDMVEAADRVDIELPHAGESFSESSPGECADRLEYLRGLGYVVPQRVIDALREEQQEMDAPPTEEISSV